MPWGSLANNSRLASQLAAPGTGGGLHLADATGTSAYSLRPEFALPSFPNPRIRTYLASLRPLREEIAIGTAGGTNALFNLITGVCRENGKIGHYYCNIMILL